MACLLGTALAVGVAASPAAAATVPDAPAAPTTVAGNAQIIVSFNAPGDDGGSPITQYEATCTSSNGGANRSQSNGGTVTPIVVGALTNGKTYTCTVNASNAEGTSPESNQSSPPVIPATVPDAPAAPTAVGGNARITLTFNPPAHNGGSAIAGYTAICTGAGTPGSALDTSSPIVVTGLDNGTAYTCTVAAINGVGTGPPSAPSSSVTPAGTPGAPPVPSVAVDGIHLVVSFSAPADNGGHPITGYTATCSAGTVMSTIEQSGPGSPITLDGVKGNSYTCVVAAINSLGTGQPSGLSAPAVIPAEAPAQPAHPTVERGNKKITVTFVPGVNNGSPITSYTTTCLGGFFPVSLSGPSSPLIVTGLTNGTRYTCTLTATNAIGTSPVSNPSVQVTPAAVPDAPGRPTVVRNIGKILVRFSAPPNNGSRIKSYTAICISSNGGVTRAQAGPNAPLTVTGVTNGRTYMCYVWASNVVGASPRSLASAPTVPGTAPAPPTITSVLPGKAPGPTGPLVVSFKAGSNNGTPITSFRVTCDSAIARDEHVVTSPGSPITVPGLVTARDYTCNVVAISMSGTSRPSAGMGARVGTPGPPKSLIVSSKRPHGLTLSFIRPGNNGDTILRYRARCTSSNGGASAGQFARGSPFPVNALTPGGRYTCKLTAINGRGEGPATNVGPVRLPF